MSKRLRLSILALSSAGAVVVSAAALEACKSDDSPPDVPVFEAGPGSDSGATACGSCLEQECVGPWALCLTDPQCHALRACAANTAAREACFCADVTAVDGGVNPLAAYRAFSTCNDAKSCSTCATDCTVNCAQGSPNTTPPACGASDGGTDAAAPDADAAAEDAGDAGIAADAGDAGDASDASINPPEPASVDGCGKCVFDRCVDARKACAIGSECVAYLSCASNCTSATCVASCGTTHRTGEVTARELSACTFTTCRTPCGL